MPLKRCHLSFVLSKIMHELKNIAYNSKWVIAFIQTFTKINLLLKLFSKNFNKFANYTTNDTIFVLKKLELLEHLRLQLLTPTLSMILSCIRITSDSTIRN